VTFSLILVIPCYGLKPVIVDEIDYSIPHPDYSEIGVNNDYSADSDEPQPRIIRPKVYIHPDLTNAMEELMEYELDLPVEQASNRTKQEIQRMFRAANIHLKNLDDGGFMIKWDGSIHPLDESDVKIGNTIVDRKNGNVTTEVDEENIFHITFAFQQAVEKLDNRHEEQIRFLFIPFSILDTSKDITVGASEEHCLCDREWFGCVGVVAIKDLTKFASSGTMVAHEFGHALGTEFHDDDGPNGHTLIMRAGVDPRATIWSKQARKLIKKHDLSCLQRDNEKQVETKSQKKNNKNIIQT